MTREGFLNGSRYLMLGDGNYIFISAIAEEGLVRPTRSLSIQRKHVEAPDIGPVPELDTTSWDAAINDVWDDPTSDICGPGRSDYKALYWKEADLIAIMGDPKAVFLAAQTGVRVNEAPLMFMGISRLLERFGAQILSRLGRLLVWTSKHVNCINMQGIVVWEWRADTSIESATINERSGSLDLEVLDLALIDTPADLSTAAVHLDLLTGTKISKN